MASDRGTVCERGSNFVPSPVKVDPTVAARLDAYLEAQRDAERAREETARRTNPLRGWGLLPTSAFVVNPLARATSEAQVAAKRALAAATSEAFALRCLTEKRGFLRGAEVLIAVEHPHHFDLDASDERYAEARAYLYAPADAVKALEADPEGEIIRRRDARAAYEEKQRADMRARQARAVEEERQRAILAAQAEAWAATPPHVRGCLRLAARLLAAGDAKGARLVAALAGAMEQEPAAPPRGEIAPDLSALDGGK